MYKSTLGKVIENNMLFFFCFVVFVIFVSFSTLVTCCHCFSHSEYLPNL